MASVKSRTFEGSLTCFFVFYSLFFILFVVISELIHYTAAKSYSGVPAHMPLIQLIVHQLMNLKGQLRDSSKVANLCSPKSFLPLFLKSLIDLDTLFINVIFEDMNLT